MKHESYGDTNCNWYTQNDPQRFDKGAESIGNRKTSGDHPNYSIVKIDQNTKRLKKTFYHSIERLSANTGMKNAQGVIIILIIKEQRKTTTNTNNNKNDQRKTTTITTTINNDYKIAKKN